MAEPTLVTVSGRPAFFNSGGEFPILVPSGLGTVSIDFKKFGTQVDFVPIVLGNGAIRLEVKPRISFLDATLSIQSQGLTVPGLSVREVDTGVEMKAGDRRSGAEPLGIQQQRPALPGRSALLRLPVPQDAREDERSRTRHHGHSGTRRAHGS
jgi:pilus assembly protein CpaC